MAQAQLGGTFTLAPDLTVHRMGYGAMQLAGPGVFGPPADRDAAVAVLRTAVELGINHIDTSDYYGPYVTNEIIREALHPYPADLHIVTKVGALAGRTRAAGRGPCAPSAPAGRPRQPGPPRPRRTRRGQPPARRVRRPGAGLGRRAVRHAGRTAEGGADQAPGRQQRQPRAVRRGAVHRAGRLRAERLQHRQPRRRRVHRRAERPGRRLHAVLPARRLQPASVRGARRGRRAARQPRRWRSPWPGCCAARRTSCSSPARPRSAHLRENVAAAALDLPADALAELDRIAAA